MLILKFAIIAMELCFCLVIGMIAWIVFWGKQGSIAQKYAEKYEKCYPVSEQLKDLIRYPTSRAILFIDMLVFVSLIMCLSIKKSCKRAPKK